MQAVQHASFSQVLRLYIKTEKWSISMTDTGKSIKQTVRDTYASIGRGESRSCCGDSSTPVSIQLGYTKERLEGLPEGADLGLGCGNPIESASINKGETVLDLGSGAGIDCFIAAGEVGVEGKVIGVDMTAEMIEKARNNAEKAGIKNVEFMLGDIESLPVDDNSVDAVISNCVINLSPDKQAVYNEAFRVLKPGGRLSVSDILARVPLPDELKRDEKLVAGCIGGAVTVEELYPVIAKAGFIDISIKPKYNSDAIISEWQPGDNIEAYVFSAYISAKKPVFPNEEKPVGSKEYFESVAGDWDEMRRGFFPESVRDAAYKAAAVREGHIAADIGAGTGFITEGLLKLGLKVIAVDQSPAMLGRMKTKFGENEKIEYQTGEAERLPIPDGSVDAAFANMYLHHVQSPADAIKEMARILKPGGVLVITDLDKHNHEFLVTEQHDRWMGFEQMDIKSWFGDAGLHSVTVDCVGDDCCAASETTQDRAKVSIFIAVGRRS
jgi:arsenite methyltransferase